jgi:probable HAF family extracellular repeat protein
LLGSDYQLSLDGHLTIDGGQASGSMVLTPFQDSRNEGTEVATVQLLAHPSYQLGSPATLGVNILDNDNVTLPLSYSITEIGPANKVSHAFALNDNVPVKVTGDYKLSKEAWRAYSWQNGTLTTIGVPLEGMGCNDPACFSYGLGINDSGVVVGYGGLGQELPFKWTSGVGITTLGILDPAHVWGNRASAINNDADIVGYCLNNLGQAHAVLWASGTTPAQDIQTLAGFDVTKQSFAAGINSAGRVVGKSMILADNTTFHAFRTAPLQPIVPSDDLGNMVGGETLLSEATWINDLDEVVGATTAANGQYHAFWKDGHTVKNQGFVDLGVLAGDNRSVALGMNNTGHVVGYSQNTVSGAARAAVWFNNGLMWDLNGHLVNGSGWVLQSAEAVNGSGAIVGWGRKGGMVRAFLLVPNN